MNRTQPKAVGGQVRIVGGRWRGTRLSVPDVAGLRPTSDRVRETLFNWLMPVLPGARVLDLFAGSGALGLEAVSRGAASAVLVEADAGAAANLRAAIDRLGAASQLNVHGGDALGWLRQPADGAFDIAFVDPPFASALWGPVLDHLTGWMAPAGWLYLESPAGVAPATSPEWALHREGATRDVRYALYRRVTLQPSFHGGDPATT